MKKSNMKWWGLWLCVTVAISCYGAYGLLGDDKSTFLADDTTHGHYQIELACESCHGEAFSDEEVMQKSCERCHGEELKSIDDSHPRKKFTDPRNAERVTILDARYCVTCHTEHKPEVTRDMGVTLADDFCVYCHEDVAEDRSSHVDLPFQGCSAAGCHNYHDNNALYEDFLVKHAGETDVALSPLVSDKDYTQWLLKVSKDKPIPLSLIDADSDKFWDMKSGELDAWSGSGHAQQGVNCKACHEGEADDQQGWQDSPNLGICKKCHAQEVKGFQSGKHGMRIAVGLSAMKPKMARQKMLETSHGKSLSCNSCHKGHEFNVHEAAVDACLSCHADDHSVAYKKSAHFILWEKELDGSAVENSGVSCATCHMSRVDIRSDGEKRILVNHNQNSNLRPNEKMIRSVCMQCHGYLFSINALADEALIDNNFNGMPSSVVPSVAWAVKRDKEKQLKRENEIENKSKE